MDASVVAAMAKWPNVPDCRGWLSLDRRGQWRLQGSPVRHAGLAEFIGRNYERDASGAWFMQNGPQQVWVELAVTPWIFRLASDGSFLTHTGEPSGDVEAAWLVDGESLCLRTTRGLGLVDDRDLQALLAQIRQADGQSLDEVDDASDKSEWVFHWQGGALPLKRCADTELPAIGGFRRSP